MANPIDGILPKKPKLSHVTREELKNLSEDELIERVLLQQQEIDTLKTKSHDPGLDGLVQTVEKLKQQVIDSTQQENKLVMRLTTKEQEIQELMTQIQEMKQSQNPSSGQLSARLLDPAINLMFYHMKQEMDLLKSKLEQAQNDLAAWKFTPDSQTGKRLMAKCRMLLQENEELGKNVSSGRVAKLEGDVALQKTLITEMKKSESATEDFLAEMDEDMEAMQSTVYLLQQELKDTRERLQKYENASVSATQSSDALSDQNSMINRTLGSEEVQRTEDGLGCASVNQNSSNSGSGNSVACWESGVGEVTDALVETTDMVKRTFQDSSRQEADSSGHDEFVVTTSDLVKNHNSDRRTSPAELSSLVDNQATAVDFSSEVGIKSEPADDGYDIDRQCHESSLRTTAWKMDSLTDSKLNGLNLLVPASDEND